MDYRKFPRASWEGGLMVTGLALWTGLPIWYAATHPADNLYGHFIYSLITVASTIAGVLSGYVAGYLIDRRKGE